MNRKQFEQWYDYNISKTCANCKNSEDVSEEYEKKGKTVILCDKILACCNENTNTRVDKYFICDLWEAI
jgi:hypothetical protein